MDINGKLELLRRSYKTETGRDFDWFCCPLLFRDENVELCRGHIRNKAIEGSSGKWTVQRKDIDNFYGSNFEADFVDIQYLTKGSVERILENRDVAKRIKPIISIAEKVVDSYTAKGSSVPDQHTMIIFETSSGSEFPVVLKIPPYQFEKTKTQDLQITIKKDLQLAVLVAAVKAAHLTLFEMYGYLYALSPGGRFVGWNVLGQFFLNNRSKSKPEVLRAAASHFEQFQNMVRLVVDHNPPLAGTISDNRLYLCETETGLTWAFIIFVRASESIHAVVIPILDEEEEGKKKEVVFHQFLAAEDSALKVRFHTFEDGELLPFPKATSFQWPK